jgi:nucleolar GTP-binding protein
MNLKYLEDPEKLLDIAFAQARKAGGLYPQQRMPFYTMKGKEIAKIEKFGNYLEKALMTVVHDFPSVDNLAPFYRELVRSVIDVDLSLKELSKISSIAKIIKKQKIQYIVKLKEMKFERGASGKAKKISNEFFGRIASMIKSLKGPIHVYNDAAKKMRELPSVRMGEESIIFAGFPNVGKSTLVKKITGSKVKVAAYPFTTKGLNIGYLEKKHLEIQVIDTPGLLDRPLHERNKIEMKAINALQYLDGKVVFVVDPTDDLEKQRNLFDELKKLFTKQKFLIAINKTDISTLEQIKAVEQKFKGIKKILEGPNLDNLKSELLADD